jgi:hypothetical protein
MQRRQSCSRRSSLQLATEAPRAYRGGAYFEVRSKADRSRAGQSWSDRSTNELGVPALSARVTTPVPAARRMSFVTPYIGVDAHGRPYTFPVESIAVGGPAKRWFAVTPTRSGVPREQDLPVRITTEQALALASAPVRASHVSYSRVSGLVACATCHSANCIELRCGKCHATEFVLALATHDAHATGDWASRVPPDRAVYLDLRNRCARVYRREAGDTYGIETFVPLVIKSAERRGHSCAGRVADGGERTAGAVRSRGASSAAVRRKRTKRAASPPCVHPEPSESSPRSPVSVPSAGKQIPEPPVIPRDPIEAALLDTPPAQAEAQLPLMTPLAHEPVDLTPIYFGAWGQPDCQW